MKTQSKRNALDTLDILDDKKETQLVNGLVVEKMQLKVALRALRWNIKVRNGLTRRQRNIFMINHEDQILTNLYLGKVKFMENFVVSFEK
jgi:hypothetical protein